MKRHLQAALVTAIVTVLALGFASEGHCDAVKPLAIYGLGRGLDYASTRHGIRLGGREGWPPTVALGGPAPAALISTAVLVGVDTELQRRGHRGWVKVLRIVATAASAAAIAHNLKVRHGR